jgi:hypothetical protein
MDLNWVFLGILWLKQMELLIKNENLGFSGWMDFYDIWFCDLHLSFGFLSYRSDIYLLCYRTYLIIQFEFI